MRTKIGNMYKELRRVMSITFYKTMKDITLDMICS